MQAHSRRPSHKAKRRRIPWKLLALCLGLASVGGAAYLGKLPAFGSATGTDRPLTVATHKGTLRILVTESGALESTKTVDGLCELIGHQNKIIQLIAEGSHVNKGDIVCRFDSGELEKNIAQQEIKAKQALSKIETSKQEVEIAKNKGESEIIAARLEFELAKLDLEMYREGTYLAETDKIRGAIGLNEKNLREALNKQEQVIALMKKGFKSPQDKRVADADVDGLQVGLRGVTQELKVKTDYEFKRKSTEFSSKTDQAQKKIEQAKATLKAQMAKTESELDSAKATHSIEDQQLKEFLRQKEKTVIQAEQEGIVAYANDRWYDPSSAIREGAMVYSRQKVFSLPDMTSMQVKVNVHESLVKKIKPGLRAEIRVEAFPNLVLIGKVKTVSNLADSSRGWSSGGVKEYSTVVTVENMPKEELKPGMTSEVKILVNEIPEALLVPIGAVAEHKGEFFAFVEQTGGKTETRKVKVGETNDKFVQIIEGLKEGENVALDARTRASALFKNDEKDEEKTAKKKDSETAKGPPG